MEFSTESILVGENQDATIVVMDGKYVIGGSAAENHKEVGEVYVSALNTMKKHNMMNAFNSMLYGLAQKEGYQPTQELRITMMASFFDGLKPEFNLAGHYHEGDKVLSILLGVPNVKAGTLKPIEFDDQTYADMMDFLQKMYEADEAGTPIPEEEILNVKHNIFNKLVARK